MQSPPVLLFGDIVAEVCTKLRAHSMLSGVTVADNKHDYEHPARWLYVERSDGERDRFFDDAGLLFEARGANTDDAYDIAQIARAICWTLPGQITNLVRVTDLAGLTRVNDPVTHESLYRFVMAFKVKGVEPS